MTAFLIVIHVLLCLLLTVSILLQSSKGGGLAGMFGGGGGGGMGSVFGGRGAASFLAKVTVWLGIGFAITSFSSALLSKGSLTKHKSLVQQVMEKGKTSSPATMLPTVPLEKNMVQGEKVQQKAVPQNKGEKTP